MKRKFKYILLIAIFIFSLTGCFSQSINKEISNPLGIKIPSKLKIEYEDVHGWFGDGETLAKIQFNDEDAEKILLEIKRDDNWLNLP